MKETQGDNRKWICWGQWAAWFTAISALWGGGFLVGGAEQFPTDMLNGTPFDSFLIPGLILGFIVGGSALLAGTAYVRNWALADELMVVAGTILLGWIVIEFVMIPEGWIPQLIWGIPGVFMFWGGYTGWREKTKTQPRS